MKVIHQFSAERLTVSDLLEAAAEASLKVEPADGMAHNLHTPAMSGSMLSYEVQPGLTASAHDVTYLSDQEFVVDIEPTLMCAVLLQGDDDVMQVDGHGSLLRRRERPVLAGFAETTKCRRQFSARHRCCGAGFAVTPRFFDHYGEHVAEDGLSTLKKFCSQPFRTETLARSPRLIDIAQRTLDHPYNGLLAGLFLECNALSFVLEVAKLMEHERRLVAQIGRTHYDRVIEAREILDASLSAPPGTLDLAAASAPTSRRCKPTSRPSSAPRSSAMCASNGC